MSESSTIVNRVWDNGVCDGLDIAAHLIEAAMIPLHPRSESKLVLVALLAVLREAQLDLQLDPT